MKLCLDSTTYNLEWIKTLGYLADLVAIPPSIFLFEGQMRK